MSDTQQNLAMTALDVLDEEQTRSLFINVEIPGATCKLMVQLTLVEESEVESAEGAFNALNEFNRQLMGRTRAERELKALKEEQFE